MLRRPVVIALSLVVLFGLVACGDDSDSETEGTAVPLADADGLAGTSWVLTEYTDASGESVTFWIKFSGCEGPYRRAYSSGAISLRA